VIERDKLHELKQKVADAPAGAVESNAVSKESSTRPSVYLAEATDDIDDLRSGVARFLDQSGLDVLPASYYPRAPAEFEASVRQDLAKCGLFIQLLSATAGKKTEDLPLGYVGLQHQIAQQNGIPILQWRDPDLALEALPASSFDGSVRIWRLPDLKLPTAVLEGGQGPVAAIAFSPSGRLLASGHRNGSVLIWEISAGETPALSGDLDQQDPLVLRPAGLETRDGQPSWVFSVAFSPDELFLASGGSGWNGTSLAAREPTRRADLRSRRDEAVPGGMAVTHRPATRGRA